MRGSLTTFPAVTIRPRSIPARAGEPRTLAETTTQTTVYPRPCGGASHVVTGSVSNAGLSPPVRGSPITGCSSRLLYRSIPARAGEPPSLHAHVLSSRVYPRPCGGATSAEDTASDLRGLSPPVRGSPMRPMCRGPWLGSIPARAGEPSDRTPFRSRRRVYPRPCGGAFAASVGSDHYEGLSPPVRGSRNLPDHRKRWTGSIPARAGEPRDRSPPYRP